MSKTEELLKVLDLPGKEQRKWLLLNVFHERMPHVSSADLAFRLRDEVDRTEFHNGIYEIQKHLKKDDWATAYWGEIFAQPIHWIIAALIAKEEAEKP